MRFEIIGVIKQKLQEKMRPGLFPKIEGTLGEVNTVYKGSTLKMNKIF
jgi:hypothetical protein